MATNVNKCTDDGSTDYFFCYFRAHALSMDRNGSYSNFILSEKMKVTERKALTSSKMLVSRMSLSYLMGNLCLVLDVLLQCQLQE